jgi:hypothetical protein
MRKPKLWVTRLSLRRFMSLRMTKWRRSRPCFTGISMSSSSGLTSLIAPIVETRMLTLVEVPSLRKRKVKWAVPAELNFTSAKLATRKSVSLDTIMLRSFLRPEMAAVESGPTASLAFAVL